VSAFDRLLLDALLGLAAFGALASGFAVLWIRTAAGLAFGSGAAFGFAALTLAAAGLSGPAAALGALAGLVAVLSFAAGALAPAPVRAQPPRALAAGVGLAVLTLVALAAVSGVATRYPAAVFGPSALDALAALALAAIAAAAAHALLGFGERAGDGPAP
jgi:hypothetical protein